MEELLARLRANLAAGILAPTGWSGVNSPGSLEQASGLWISHGTARRYTPGTTSTDYVNPLWEWAALFEGGFIVHTETESYPLQAPCWYIVPPGLRLGVQVAGATTLAAWFTVDGALARDALIPRGGHPERITSGPPLPAQAHHALAITRLLFTRPPGLPTLLQAQLWAFLAATMSSPSGSSGLVPTYSPEITRVLHHLDADQGGPPLPNSQLATLAALAPSSFRRRFTAEVGQSPRHYQLRQRLRQAKHLLIQEAIPIKTIAYQLGFADQLYFSRLFARYEGISPREFRHRFNTEPGRQAQDEG